MSQAYIGSKTGHESQSAWVKLRMTPQLRLALEKYPMAAEQTISEEAGSLIVTAQLVVNADFLHWIFALGSDVEVLMPLQLRELVRSGISSALDQYRIV